MTLDNSVRPETTLSNSERPGTRSNAQVLREAAALLRRLGRAVDQGDADWWDLDLLREDLPSADDADLEWIAALDPALAEPLADLLEAAIQPRTGRNRHRGRIPVGPALVVARRLLGEA